MITALDRAVTYSCCAGGMMIGAKLHGSYVGSWPMLATTVVFAAVIYGLISALQDGGRK